MYAAVHYQRTGVVSGGVVDRIFTLYRCGCGCGVGGHASKDTSVGVGGIEEHA